MVALESPEALIAVPLESAARLAGVSSRRLRYWDQTGLVVPHIKEQVTDRTTVRLYEFRDLVELLVVIALLRERISLRHIRKVVQYLRRLGYSAPLRELRFAVLGDEVFFEHSDGTWFGDRKPEQLVLRHVLPLEEIRATILSRATRRPPATEGRIVRRRKVAGSKPVFAGTRIAVATVLDYLAHGYSDQRILEAFPDLTRIDIAAARTRAGAA